MYFHIPRDLHSFWCLITFQLFVLISLPSSLTWPDLFLPSLTFFILTLPSRPLKIYSSFSSSQKKKKTYRLVLICFLLGALKFLESGSTQKKKRKKKKRAVGSFLKYFLKGALKFHHSQISRSSLNSLLSFLSLHLQNFRLGSSHFQNYAGLVGDQCISSSLIYLIFNRFLVLNF